MPSYSKAPRGLFVLLQVDGIFTVIAISPSSSLRQFPSRYAFDAGQNLPVKEFRSFLLTLGRPRERTIFFSALRRVSAFSLWGVAGEATSLLIVRTEHIITFYKVVSDSRSFQHTAECLRTYYIFNSIGSYFSFFLFYLFTITIIVPVLEITLER